MSARLTPLHIAAGLGDVVTVRALLRGGADPSALEPDCGASPLHLAAQGGSPAVGPVGCPVDPSEGLSAV